MKSIPLLAIITLFLGCSPYHVRDLDKPEIDVPPSFVHLNELKTGRVVLEGFEDERLYGFWTEYKRESLDNLIDQAFSNNFSLQDMLARVGAARAQLQVDGAAQYPELSTDIIGRRTRISSTTPLFGAGFTPATEIIQNQFNLNNALSYEVDLWNRVSSGRAASSLRYEASEADLEQAMLLVANEVLLQWTTAIEGKRLIALLEEQIASSKRFLELTSLRFQMAQGTALDVLEQRSQLASLQAQLPRAKLQLGQALNRLSVLVGKVPGTIQAEDLEPNLPSLEESILSIRPIDLLILRPDLRALQKRLQASEYDIAVAVADRFPRLALGFTYNFATREIEELFPNKTISGFSSFLTPIIDGGRRKALVEREKAEVDQLIAQFSERFLVALQEVEDALLGEKYQREIVSEVRKQLEAAKATLVESRSRYMNGATDYLRVLLALQSTQVLERLVIIEERQLLLARNRLLLAMGGVVPRQESQKEESFHLNDSYNAPWLEELTICHRPESKTENMCRFDMSEEVLQSVEFISIERVL